MPDRLPRRRADGEIRGLLVGRADVGGELALQGVGIGQLSQERKVVFRPDHRQAVCRPRAAHARLRIVENGIKVLSGRRVAALRPSDGEQFGRRRRCPRGGLPQGTLG